MNRMQRFAVVVALSVLSMTAHSQNATLEGQYTRIEARSTDIEAAIANVVGEMNFIKRPIARSRLKKTNPAYTQIVIARSGENIEVTFDDGGTIKSPADGRPIDWKREDGEIFAVSTQWEANRLVQTFKAEDGIRMNTFSLNERGELVLDVSIQSEQLPRPLTYSLLYRRTS